jgi:hypothetical protein
MLKCKIFANLTALTHFYFILFVVSGGVFVSDWSGAMLLHLLSVIYGIVNRKLNMGCFLTEWERSLRAKAGEQINWPHNEFMPHYIWSHFGRTGYEKSSRRIMLSLIIILNFYPYSLWINRLVAN